MNTRCDCVCTQKPPINYYQQMVVSNIPLGTVIFLQYTLSFMYAIVYDKFHAVIAVFDCHDLNFQAIHNCLQASVP